jgi:hypothetical protein
MSEYTIIENAFIGCDDAVLFQRPAFFHMHSRVGASYFELCFRGSVKACIHFTPIDREGAWRSPARGTFAGLTFFENLKYQELFLFFQAVESSLLRKGARELEVLLAPEAHDTSAFARQVYLFRSFGFETSRLDINQSMDIDARAFSERITYGNLKRLRKCSRAGFVTRALSFSELPEVYNTLSINRAAKGHSLSMTLAELELMVKSFPRDIVLFGCLDGRILAASALCIRISSSVLYVFYWGDRPEYATHSPVVAVADAIYRYAQEQGFRVLDVGASTIDRDINFGLLDFKRGLGFVESLKLTMKKHL